MHQEPLESSELGLAGSGERDQEEDIHPHADIKRIPTVNKQALPSKLVTFSRNYNLGEGMAPLIGCEEIQCNVAILPQKGRFNK